MAEQKSRPFDAIELGIISKAQAVACPGENDVRGTSKGPGRLKLKLSPIAEQVPGKPGKPLRHPSTSTSTLTITAAKATADSSYSLCSVDNWTSSRLSSTAALDTNVSSYPPDIGDDCAGMVLACLYCRFYDMCLMLPGTCNRAAQHLFPAYQNFTRSAERAHGGGGKDGDCNCGCDFDCGLLDLCQETGDCLELAMEVSEVCYH